MYERDRVLDKGSIPGKRNRKHKVLRKKIKKTMERSLLKVRGCRGEAGEVA